jgi:Ran GTPase-activating protein (RanGAP) involved in mRNA processing and transport
MHRLDELSLPNRIKQNIAMPLKEVKAEVKVKGADKLKISSKSAIDGLLLAEQLAVAESLFLLRRSLVQNTLVSIDTDDSDSEMDETESEEESESEEEETESEEDETESEEDETESEEESGPDCISGSEDEAVVKG